MTRVREGPSHIPETAGTQVDSVGVSAAMVIRKVMSASDKPRLAGRQPSFRGGVLRVTTWPSGTCPSASADSW